MFILSLFFSIAASSPLPTWLVTRDGCRNLSEAAVVEFNARVEREMGTKCEFRDEGNPPTIRIYTCGRNKNYFYFWDQGTCERARQRLEEKPASQGA